MYKVIDGIIYKQIDSSELQQKVTALKDEAGAYVRGIGEADRQIAAYISQKEQYKEQIRNILKNRDIDLDMLELLDQNYARILKDSIK